MKSDPVGAEELKAKPVQSLWAGKRLLVSTSVFGCAVSVCGSDVPGWHHAHSTWIMLRLGWVRVIVMLIGSPSSRSWVGVATSVNPGPATTVLSAAAATPVPEELLATTEKLYGV
jgi:hypothetical protein